MADLKRQIDSALVVANEAVYVRPDINYSSSCVGFELAPRWLVNQGAFDSVILIMISSPAQPAFFCTPGMLVRVVAN